MFFKKNNLDKELGKIKSDLENMMLEHQRKVDEELNTLYDEMRENLTVIVKDDEQILKEVKENLAREKEERDIQTEKIKNFLGRCKNFLTQDISIDIFKNDNIEESDDFELERFIDAQDKIYPYILKEIKTGKKTSHWMWFIFPQIIGLGKSDMSKKYAILDIDEARAYLKHPILGNRLQECCIALLKLPKDLSSKDIFGAIDSRKLRSSMTLFSLVGDNKSAIFNQVLEKFFDGILCKKTESIVLKQKNTILGIENNEN